MSTNKRKAYTLEDKYDAIQRTESKEATQECIAKELGTHRSTVTKWCNAKN